MNPSRLFWNISSQIYRTLGPKNAWKFAMSPLPKFFIDSFIRFFGKKEIITRVRYGFKIKIRIEDFLVGGFLHLGETNPHETGILRKILKKGDVFFDVGAYRGWYALNASQKVGPNGKVFAFEPNSAISSILKENCNINYMSNIIVQQTALSDSSGSKKFWVGGEDMLGSLKKEHVTANTKTKTTNFTVPTQTLDTFCKENKINHIKMIKIDVEGADLEVIKGGKNILKNFSPYLIVEVFGLSMNTHKERKQEIISYLSSLGYTTYEFVGDKLKVLKGEKESQIINLFFAKNDKELRKYNLIET